MAVPIEEAAAFLGCQARAVAPRLFYLGYKQRCGRCAGTGHHSYNRRDGTVCYGCMGAKFRLPVLTKKLLREARERIGRGELEPYFEENRRRRVVMELPERVERAQRATLVDSTHTWNWTRVPKESELYRRFHRMLEAFARAQQLAEGVKKGTVGIDEAYAEVEALVEKVRAAEMTAEEIRADGFEPLTREEMLERQRRFREERQQEALRRRLAPALD